jgi:hypothetical protein
MGVHDKTQFCRSGQDLADPLAGTPGQHAA